MLGLRHRQQAQHFGSSWQECLAAAMPAAWLALTGLIMAQGMQFMVQVLNMATVRMYNRKIFQCCRIWGGACKSQTKAVIYPSEPLKNIQDLLLCDGLVGRLRVGLGCRSKNRVDVDINERKQLRMEWGSGFTQLSINPVLEQTCYTQWKGSTTNQKPTLLFFLFSPLAKPYFEQFVLQLLWAWVKHLEKSKTKTSSEPG